MAITACPHMLGSLLLTFTLTMLFGAQGSPPIVVPYSPAVPTYDASQLPTPWPHPFPGGCINPTWTSANAVTCLMPRINGKIYDGPRNPAWDTTGIRSKWEIKTGRAQTPVVGIMVAHIPGGDNYVFIGRTSTLSFTTAGDVLAGVYDLKTNTFRNISSDTNSFCGGIAPTHDGRMLVAGGTTAERVGGSPDGRASIRLYDYKRAPVRLPDTTKMLYNRWYPTVTLLADNNVFIMGGTRTATERSTPWPWFERWEAKNETAFPIPRLPVEPTFVPEMGKQFYPAVFVLGTGDVFVLQDQFSRIIKPSGVYRTVSSNGQQVQLKGPQYPSAWKTQFPHIGTAVMLGLTFENDYYGSAEIVMFGGAPFPDTTNVTLWCPSVNNTAKTTPANPYSYRLKISWRWDLTTNDWMYTFGTWRQEFMGIPRVGGDSVLLPNGDVVIVGGAQTGCSCGIRTGVNRGNYPALWPLLYQPDRPEGQRYTVMSATSIARMYHATAVLTSSGTIIVQGCDACEKKTIVSSASWWNGSADQRWEFRIEEFFPPYALDYAAKPRITHINSINNPATIVDLSYGQTFTIHWVPLDPTQGDIRVSKVSLVAPSAVTHGFNSNQRVVFLRIVSQVGNTLTVHIPVYAGPTLGVLPPQIYKIFIMNGKTYSTAWWVKLTKPLAVTG